MTESSSEIPAQPAPEQASQEAPEPVSKTLEEALERFDLQPPEDQVEQLDLYCRLLWAWNEKLNLTRHTDYDKFVSRDLIDTLELAKLLHEGEDLLDVGTGGGAPGVLLAILRPDLQVSLCESVEKKALALEDIVSQLGLSTPLFHARAESILDDFRYDALVARAVGPLWKMCMWFEPHWASIGRVLAIKGPRWTEERKEARHRGLMANLELRCVATYPMPGTDSESVILKLWHKGRDEPK